MSKTRSRWTRMRLAGGAIVSLALIATAITLWPEKNLSEAEVRALVDPDLLIEWPTIPDDENALMRAWGLTDKLLSETGVQPAVARARWKEMDEDHQRKLKDWVRAFEPYAGAVVRTLEGEGVEPKPDLADKTPWDAGYQPFVGVWALASRATLSCAEGDQDRCELNTIDALRALGKIQRFHVSEVGLGGVDQHRQLLTFLLDDVLANDWLDPARLKRLLLEIPEGRESWPQYVVSLKADFTFRKLPMATKKGLYELVQRSNEPNPFGKLDQATTARLLSDLYAERIANVAKPRSERKWPAHLRALSYVEPINHQVVASAPGWAPERIAYVEESMRVRKMVNHRGRFLIAVLGDPYNESMQQRERATAEWDALRKRVAIKAQQP